MNLNRKLNRRSQNEHRKGLKMMEHRNNLESLLRENEFLRKSNEQLAKETTKLKEEINMWLYILNDVQACVSVLTPHDKKQIEELTAENHALKEEISELQYRIDDLNESLHIAEYEAESEELRRCGEITIEGIHTSAQYQDVVGILLHNGYEVELTPVQNGSKLKIILKKVRVTSMSSAKNHKIRSHRSYRNKVSTVERFQKKQIIKNSQQKALKESGNFFTKLMGLFKKGDK